MTDSAAPAALGGCVHCHAPLTLSDHENVQLLSCPQGHGVFINADALRIAVREAIDDRSEAEEQAAEAAQTPIPAEELEQNEQPRACPTCGAEMAKRVYAYESGVPIDVCEEHGIWLDAGELQRIEAWYEAQLAHRDADRDVWGGKDGRLEQIEATSERERMEQVREIHVRPVGWFFGRTSWWLDRRDDR